MEQVSSDARLREIRREGRGVVYNDFSGHGPAGARFNVLHAASCRWLARANLAVRKYWFPDLAEGVAWLVRARGTEGQAWRRCATCGGGDLADLSPRSGPPRTTTGRTPSSPAAAGEGYLVVSHSGAPIVEAWSTERLPFEPRGSMRAYRDALRAAIAPLTGAEDQALRATYTSPVEARADVENVLLYNVGPGVFRRCATWGLVAERVQGHVPDPPAVIAGARHHHRYEIVPGDAGWHAWTTAEELASFGPTRLPERPTAAQVWHAVRRTTRRISGEAHVGASFGLLLTLEMAPAPRVNLAAIVKPLVDGVVAAFHAHDDPGSLEVVATRVAEELDAPLDEVRDLLRDDTLAVLGTRRLLWPWRNGVQWNPADDRCMALSIRRHEPPVGEAGGQSGCRAHGVLVSIATA